MYSALLLVLRTPHRARDMPRLDATRDRSTPSDVGDDPEGASGDPLSQLTPPRRRSTPPSLSAADASRKRRREAEARDARVAPTAPREPHAREGGGGGDGGFSVAKVVSAPPKSAPPSAPPKSAPAKDEEAKASARKLRRRSRLLHDALLLACEELEDRDRAENVERRAAAFVKMAETKGGASGGA